MWGKHITLVEAFKKSITHNIIWSGFPLRGKLYCFHADRWKEPRKIHHDAFRNGQTARKIGRKDEAGEKRNSLKLKWLIKKPLKFDSRTYMGVCVLCTFGRCRTKGKDRRTSKDLATGFWRTVAWVERLGVEKCTISPFDVARWPVRFVRERVPSRPRR